MTDLDGRIVRLERSVAASTLAVSGMRSVVAFAAAWWWLAPLAVVGDAANRVLFGVIRPVPSARRNCERAV
ncbi:MAG: hypothetical protein ABEJ73_01195 [Haloplanus sp.]